MQRQIPILRITEERIFGDIAIGAVLPGDQSRPITTLIAEDVAAGQHDLVSGVLDRLAPMVEGDDGVLDCGWRQNDATERDCAPFGTGVPIESALNQCKTARSGADRTASKTRVSYETTLGACDVAIKVDEDGPRVSDGLIVNEDAIVNSEIAVIDTDGTTKVVAVSAGDRDSLEAAGHVSVESSA